MTTCDILVCAACFAVMHIILLCVIDNHILDVAKAIRELKDGK